METENVKLDELAVRRTRRVVARSELEGPACQSVPGPPDTQATSQAEEKIIGRQCLDWASGGKRDNTPGSGNSTGREVEEKDCFLKNEPQKLLKTKGRHLVQKKRTPELGSVRWCFIEIGGDNASSLM
jgi:hypothetical protein